MRMRDWNHLVPAVRHAARPGEPSLAPARLPRKEYNVTRSHAAVLGCVATAAVAVAAWQQPAKVSVASMPPSVVKTVSQSGDM